MTTDVAQAAPGLAADDPLGPLRAALLAAARQTAERTVRSAEAAAGERLAEARAHAAELMAEARTRGEAEAASLMATESAAAHRAARLVVLAAQHAVYQQLRAAACVAVRDLLADETNRARLAALLRSRLGEAAVVISTADGGLHATSSDGRAVDASCGALVDLALGTLDGEALWSAP